MSYRPKDIPGSHGNITHRESIRHMLEAALNFIKEAEVKCMDRSNSDLLWEDVSEISSSLETMIHHQFRPNRRKSDEK